MSRNADIQRLLAAGGYYTGAIDGILGAKSRTAIDAILGRRASDCSTNPARWSQDRRAIGAAQLILKYAGYSPGSVDGYWGNGTQGAYLEWSTKILTGKDLVLDRTPIAKPVASPFPRQANLNSFYGTPDTKALTSQLVMVDLPFRMRIDWNLSQTTTRVQLHKKCADSAHAAMTDILREYGEARLREYGLDRNAGTYNSRKMRGGTSWSLHAYGAAWDFYAGMNGLTTRCPQALFCKPEYKTFFDIWEAHGWTSLGRAIGRDWMHVQAASL